MKPDFKKGDGLIPVIVQDSKSLIVLMLGYMNEEAWIKTAETGFVTFFSRSKQRLWTKGETSGNYLKVIDMRLDCDLDTLLIKVEPEGPVCHTGTLSCFGDQSTGLFFGELEKIICNRSVEGSDESYTKKLLSSGIDRVAQKVGEEAVETVIAAKNSDRNAFIGEASDLMFHWLVLLRQKEVTLQEVSDCLKQRHWQRAVK